MADGGGDRVPVNCGVQIKGDKYVLTYRVGKKFKKKREISWKWEEENGKYVASLLAQPEAGGDIRYHKSAAIGADARDALSDPDLDLDGEYFKVKFRVVQSKRPPNMPDLSEIFNVAQ